MFTFEQYIQSGYLAYTIDSSSRAELLKHFKPKYPDVICHHVTYKFPAKSNEDLPPAAHEAHVVGYAEDDGIEALVVEINGQTKRPSDGKFLHITLSLDRKKGKKPVHSNALLSKNGYKHISPISIKLEPAFLQ